MKTIPILTLAALLAAATAQAAITVPGANNTDGELLITANTVIDLAQAVDAAWDSDNTPNAGKGVYDSNKWAVVFKYSRVVVDAGATVTFKNHPSRAPVVWLVDGNVDVSGTVHLNGENGVSPLGHAEPGPGGFRGATGQYTSGVGAGAGFGVGGADLWGYGAGGSYGTKGASTSPVPYGNPSLVPLIGGSGGGGHPGHGGGAGAGGGAMLIAATGDIAVTGVLAANGGHYQWPAGAGSGGGVRVVCNTLTVNGSLTAVGGNGERGPGGLGRIRLERVAAAGSPSAITPDPSVVPLAPSATALIWPPDDAPSVRILTIGSRPVPADPRATFGVAGPDVALAETSSTEVIVETVNVEQASQVEVRVTPRANATYVVANAAVSNVVSDSPLTLHWVATLPVQVGYSAVQVKVVRP